MLFRSDIARLDEALQLLLIPKDPDDRRAAGVVARLATLLAGPSYIVGAGRLPGHMLLLPRRVLQSVLGRPARVRRRGAAQELRRQRALAAAFAA